MVLHLPCLGQWCSIYHASGNGAPFTIRRATVSGTPYLVLSLPCISFSRFPLPSFLLLFCSFSFFPSLYTIYQISPSTSLPICICSFPFLSFPSLSIFFQISPLNFPSCSFPFFPSLYSFYQISLSTSLLFVFLFCSFPFFPSLYIFFTRFPPQLFFRLRGRGKMEHILPQINCRIQGWDVPTPQCIYDTVCGGGVGGGGDSFRDISLNRQQLATQPTLYMFKPQNVCQYKLCTTYSCGFSGGIFLILRSENYNIFCVEKGHFYFVLFSKIFHL
jgi:hypothetical protein